MDENKVPQLIDEVQRRPAIWNKLLNEHRFKAFVGTEWDKVAANIRVSKNQAQNKWKTLVKKFKGEHSRVQLHRSGDSLEDSYESNWPYYQSLSFLASSVLPNPSTGNLDVIKSPTKIEIEESDCQEVDGNMNKKIEIAEEILRMHSEKCALLGKSSTNNTCENNSAELDKHNLTFFETLLPTLREVSKEDILLCRNDVPRVIFNYAYKNAAWKSITDCAEKETSVLSTPAPPKRKRQMMDDDDCQIVSMYPPRPYLQPSIPTKVEQKYKPTAREREIERRNSEMKRLGYNLHGYTPRPAWKWNDHVYQQQVLPYPGQRQLHSIENLEWYSQGGIPTPDSHLSAIVSPESIPRQIPSTHAVSAVGRDFVPRHMPPFTINPATSGNSECLGRQIPPSAALTQGVNSTPKLQRAAKLTQSTTSFPETAIANTNENQNSRFPICEDPVTTENLVPNTQTVDQHNKSVE